MTPLGMTVPDSALNRLKNMDNMADAFNAVGQGQPNNAQGASRTLAEYMKRTNEQKLDPQKLYQLATNDSGDVPGEVSEAAKFMMKNPGTYKRIETHDNPQSDGKTSADNLRWAAGGGLQSNAGAGADVQGLGHNLLQSLGGGYSQTSFMDEKMAAGSLASHMAQTGKSSLTMNDLFNMATNASGDVSPGASAAAQWMLDNPDAYKKIETLDVKRSDGRTGIENLMNTAYGGNNGPQQLAQQLLQAVVELMEAQQGLGNPKQAAGKIADHMQKNGINAMNVASLYKLANNASGKVPSQVSQAAATLLRNPDIMAKIDTHDVSGGDGLAALNNFRAAQNGKLRGGNDDPLARISQFGQHNSGAMMSPQMAAGALAAHMTDKGMSKLNITDLYKIATGKGGEVPSGVKAAAQFMLSNPAIYAKLETQDVKGQDGLSGIGNFLKTAFGDHHAKKPVQGMMQA